MQNRLIEDLKNRKDEIKQMILRKQKPIQRYRRLLERLEKDCSELREEYKIIDREVFLREHSVTKIVRKNGNKKKLKTSINQNIRDLSEADTAILLKQLLRIQAERQSIRL